MPGHRVGVALPAQCWAGRDNGQVSGRKPLLSVAAAALVAASAACQPAHSAGPGSRSDAGGTVVAVRPAGTTAPSGPGVPPLSQEAHAAGFVDLRTVVPDAIVDLRYATTNNFTKTQLYPADARCLVHQSLAPGLAAAANALRPQGHVLVFWDCYRPHEVQVKMFQIVPNPAWVARPGPYATSHESGRSVDVTYTGAQPQCPPQRLVTGICLSDMGTDFDDFTSRANALSQDVSVEAQANRKRLRDAMNYGGLTVYAGEWWHFDGPGAGVHRPILDVPVD